MAVCWSFTMSIYRLLIDFEEGNSCEWRLLRFLALGLLLVELAGRRMKRC